MRPLLLCDAPYLLYRAFFALPKSIKGADSKPVNALLGSVNAILAAAEEHDARAVVACFGPDAAPYRVELYSGYHAQRPPVPDELAHQWEKARGLYEALGWEVAEDQTVEADDLLGSYAEAESKGGGSALILTGDRDLFQCVTKRVRVLLAARGGPQLVDESEVKKRYGIEPALVPDFIALRGDPSDRLPGAPGVGPKTAASLLKQYGSLEAALDEGRFPNIRKELELYRRIATLDASAPLPPLEDQSPTWAEASSLLESWGLGNLAGRIAARSA